MPSFVTHYYFGQEVKKVIPLDKACEEYPLAFNMGLQGPDLFFYYFDKSTPKDGSMRPAQLGTFLHNHCIYEQFVNILDFIKKHEDNKRYIAYAYGLLCHYSMDSVAHPFIYFMQEDVLPALTPEKIHNTLHIWFETRLDNYVFNEKLDRSIKKFSNAVKTDNEDREAIADFCIGVFDPMLHMHIDKKKVIKACKFFKTYQNIFDDPTKIMPTLMKGVSAIASYPSKLYGFIHPGKINEKDDLFNTTHRLWPRVRKEDEVVDWSFEDVLSKCITRAEDVIGDFNEARETGKELDASLYTVTYDGNRILSETMDTAIDNAEQGIVD